MNALITLGAMLLAAVPGGITVAEIIGAVVMTAFTALSSLIFAKKKNNDTFEPTQYTRREVGGTIPIIVGTRRTYGVEVFRKNDSTYAGASSRQFFQIHYSIGTIAFICDSAVYGEKNLFDLGHSGAHSSVIDFRFGTNDQLPTGHGWTEIAGDPSLAKNKYDALGLKLTPDSTHAVSYSGRAGINIFLAADEDGRSQGMNIAVDSLIYGLLCRRFKDENGNYLCHVGDHNKYAEFYASSKRYTGIVNAGNYTASELADVLETALNEALDDESTGHAITFSVSYSSETDQFTIESDTENVRLLTWSGSHRGNDIWDELGMIRGARYSFDPTKTGGTNFDDLRLTGSNPYSVSTFEDFSFTKTFTRNPIRICYELRTNPNTSPGIEHWDDFAQSLMFSEEQYCNEIASNPDTSIQYDIRPVNILPMLKAIYGSDGLISGTMAKPNELLLLIDGSRTSETDATAATNGAYVPQIVIAFGSGSLRYDINQIVIKTNSVVAQSYKLQYVDKQAHSGIKLPGTNYYEGWSDSDWSDVTGGLISGSTDAVKTIAFTKVSAYGIRIIDFSAVTGNFSLSEIEVKTQSFKTSKNIAIQSTVYTVSTEVVVDAFGTGDVSRLNDGSSATNVEFIASPSMSESYYEIRFPFKRRIGLIVLATNIGDPQSYSIYYQIATGGDWTLLETRTNSQGTDYCFVTPTEMISFRITNMSREAGNFTITEIEAYDAIPSVRYTLDAINESGQKFSDFMLRLYESFFAIPCDQYGTRFIRVERDEPAVQELNDNHIIACKRKPTPRREMVNQWLVTFANELKDFESDIVTIDDYASQLREMQYPGGGSGNLVTPREIELLGVVRPMQAQRMGHVLKKRARYGYVTYTITCRAGAVIAKIGDIIRIHKPSARINKKYARIIRMIYRGNHEIEIEAMEHYSNVYASPQIEVGDIEFTRDSAGSSGSSGVIPGDVKNVALVILEPGDYGIATPTLQVTFTPPSDSNFSHANIWINWDEAETDDGALFYRLEGTSIGDGAFTVPVNASGGIDDQYKIRVVVQAVSNTGTKKDITSIVEAWERGENTCIAETSILFDGSQALTARVAALVSSQASTGQSAKYFTGDGNQVLFDLGFAYTEGSLIVRIDGIHINKKIIGINDGTEGSPEAWEYDETDPEAGTFTFLYPPPNGAIIGVVYARSAVAV